MPPVLAGLQPCLKRSRAAAGSCKPSASPAVLPLPVLSRFSPALTPGLTLYGSHPAAAPAGEALGARGGPSAAEVLPARPVCLALGAPAPIFRLQHRSLQYPKLTEAAASGDFATTCLSRSGHAGSKQAFAYPKCLLNTSANKTRPLGGIPNTDGLREEPLQSLFSVAGGKAERSCAGTSGRATDLHGLRARSQPRRAAATKSGSSANSLRRGTS